MPQTDRHKEREIPIEFDFYNTLESLPMNNRCNARNMRKWCKRNQRNYLYY